MLLKEFCDLSGLKRSTIRHYEEKGLLETVKDDSNGYHNFDEISLLDAVLVKKARCLRIPINGVNDYISQDIYSQIDSLEEMKEDILHQIDELNHALETIEMNHRILSECAQDRKIIYREGIKVGILTLVDAQSKNKKASIEEIAHCVNSFPFIRLISKGSLKQLEKNGIADCAMGYQYATEKGFFKPIHPELYQEVPDQECVLFRTKVDNPLHMRKEDLKPILTEMKKTKFHPQDEFFVSIHSMEKSQQGTKYIVTVRLLKK